MVLRRRNNTTSASSPNNDHGYIPSDSNQTYVNSGSSEAPVWTSSAYGPPLYENIYDSSVPITNNIPPPYDIVKNKKLPEAIVIGNIQVSTNLSGLDQQQMTQTIQQSDNNTSRTTDDMNGVSQIERNDSNFDGSSDVSTKRDSGLEINEENKKK